MLALALAWLATLLMLVLACVLALMHFLVVLAQFMVGLKRLSALMTFNLAAFFLSVAHYVTSDVGLTQLSVPGFPISFQFRSDDSLFFGTLNIEWRGRDSSVNPAEPVVSEGTCGTRSTLN